MEKELLKFKITLLLLPVIPATILYYKHHYNIVYLLLAVCWGLLFILLLTKFFGINADKPVYEFIKKCLKYLGIVLSVIALVITWVCAVFPTGIIALLAKRDRLSLKKQNTKSYWKDVKDVQPSYENQY